MIQILGLRRFADKDSGKEKVYDAFFDKGWRAPSVRDIFENYAEHVKKIPKKEQFNIYYTMALCTEEKRKFLKQEVMGFDIDGMDVTNVNAYIDPIAHVLQINIRKHAHICFSGNGLQLMVELKTPILSDKFFDEMRLHYRAVCENIDRKLAELGLPGKADPSVFSTARIMRMPGTLNKKPNKPERLATVINVADEACDLDLTKISGLPVVNKDDQISPQAFKKYPTPDTPAVLSGCAFLKACKETPGKITEPQWYAMLSITTRLKDGIKLSHDLSEGHPSYTHGETEQKIQQSQNFGPRTCSNIGNIWDGCKACPNFQKVTSPILIRGPDYIKTQDTGFHDVFVDPDTGKKKIGKPNYEDLRKFFMAKYDFRIMGESKICYVWNGKHYEVMADAYLENFANEHFVPLATTTMRQEFKSLICTSNLVPPQWFIKTTEGAINFNNGIFDLKTRELSPHTKERGYRYVLPYDYDPTAKAPKFEQFLVDITNNDQALQDIILEYGGYSFSNDKCWTEKALVCTGEGANGKSTLLNVFRELAGKTNYCSLTLNELKSETSRQQFDGKLFNIAEETPNYALMESSLFKNLVTGGETQIRMLYKQPYSIRNKCKLIFACNELPKTKDTTDGYFRRFLIVPFDQKFAGNRRDPHIFEKLITELPGIFNLVFKGYQRLHANRGFTHSTVVEEQLKAYKNDIDNASRWIRENIHAKPLNGGSPYVSIPDAYANYRVETENNGEDAITAVAFGRKLAKHVPDYEERYKLKKVQNKVFRVLLDTDMGTQLSV